MENTHFDIEKELVFGDKIEWRKVDHAARYLQAEKILNRLREAYPNSTYRLVRVRRKVL